MTAFPKYPSYKSSGVEWLPEVPTHWEVEKARWMFRKLERPISKDDGIVTCYRDGQVALRSRRREEGYTMAILEQGYQSVRKGELVVHGMDAFAGAIGVSEDDGKCTPEYSVLKPTRPDINNHYFAHLLRVMAARGYIHIICPSVRERAPRFRFPKLQDSRLPIPPLAEQDRIVAFLDEKTAEIDRLIAKKQRQLELLDEQKAILINRAVTRGIRNGELGMVNEEAPEGPHSQFNIQNSQFTNSGIPWIGPIPKHWKVGRVRHLFHNLDNRRVPLSAVERGRMTKRLYDYYGASGVIDQVDDYLYDEDLLLIAEDGANLVMRNLPLAIIARGKYWVNNHAHILKPKSGVLEYWFHALECADYSTSITGAAQPKLTKDALADISLPHPPLAEQEEIVRELTSLCDKLKKVSELFESQIQTLRTLRSTLIAHAVTGKIKL